MEFAEPEKQCPPTLWERERERGLTENSDSYNPRRRARVFVAAVSTAQSLKLTPMPVNLPTTTPS